MKTSLLAHTGAALTCALALSVAPVWAQPPVPASGPAFDLFAGLDGSKQPQDLGINANMGARLAAGLTLPLSSTRGFGLQVGAGLNLSDAAVHVLDQIDGTSRRAQRFVTVGVYQQGARLVWAANVDYLHQSYYDTMSLAQARGLVGVHASPATEVGVLGSAALKDDTADAAGTPVTVRPIGQVAAYVTRTWSYGATTRAWAGVTAAHHNVVFVFPDNSQTRRPLVYGAQLDMPLSPRLSVTGAANFVTPTATGTVDAYLGLSFFPGRVRRPGRASRAVLPIANNPEFPVDLRR